MTMQATIKNDEAVGSTRRLAVTVVTVGNLDAAETKHELGAQEQVSVHVHGGQFVIVDETELEDL